MKNYHCFKKPSLLFFKPSTQLATAQMGFSLIEVLIVVMIIGIFAAIAAPAWEAFTSRQRLRTINNQVLQSLKTAQVEAKRQKEDIIVTFFQGELKVQVGDLPEQELNAEGEIPDGKYQLSIQANGAAATSITFNNLGAVEDPEINTTGANTDGFTVTASLIDSPNAKQCVIIQTILGSMRTAESTDCP